MSIASGTGTADTLWNRITINSSAAGEHATYRSGTHEFVYDTTGVNSDGRFVVFATEGRGDSETEPTRIRMQIGTGFDIWYPIASQFAVWDRSDASGVARIRIWVRDLSSTYYHITGGDTTFSERQNDGTNAGRYQIGDAEFWWRWPTSTNTYKHWIAFARNEDSTGNGSALIKNLNAFGYGVTQEWRSTSTGGNGRLEFKDAGNTVMVALHAAAFTPVSKASTKRNIEPLPDNAAAVAKGLLVHQYHREDQDDSQPPVFGIMAEGAPDGIRVDDENGVPTGIDLYSLTSLVLKYGQEMDKRLTALEGKGPR
jgi:hypothetical protein